MNAMRLACVGLLVSSILLAGLLIVQLGKRPADAEQADSPDPAAISRLLENEARGEMVITRDDFTLMTTQTRNGEEAMFVLDNTSGRLLIYTTSIPNGEINLVGGANMPRVFGRQ